MWKDDDRRPPCAQDNIFEWHFAIRGAWDTEFEVRPRLWSARPSACTSPRCQRRHSCVALSGPLINKAFYLHGLFSAHPGSLCSAPR